MLVRNDVGDIYDIGADDDDIGALDDVGAFGFARQLQQNKALQARARQQATNRGIVRSPTRAPLQQQAPQIMARPPIMSSIPGVSPVSLKRLPLGLGTVTFGAATGTALQMSVQPQVPFQGSRLILGIARTGASSTGLVNVSQFSVGVNNQLAGTSPLPADLFNALATDVILVCAPAQPGINITLTLTISAAPAGADTVVVSGVFLGEVIQG